MIDKEKVYTIVPGNIKWEDYETRGIHVEIRRIVRDSTSRGSLIDVFCKEVPNYTELVVGYTPYGNACEDDPSKLTEIGQYFAGASGTALIPKKQVGRAPFP